MSAQGSVTNAKEDTVLLVTNGDLVTDLSQYATPLTAVADPNFVHLNFVTYYTVFRVNNTSINRMPNAGQVSGTFGMHVGASLNMDRADMGTTAGPFDFIECNIATAGSGFTQKYQYWDGAWQDITVTDGTNGFLTTGTNRIYFNRPTDWAADGGIWKFRAQVLTPSLDSSTGNWAKVGEYAGHYELASARTAITGATGRELYVRGALLAAEAAVILLAHHSADVATIAYAIGTDNSGNFALYGAGGAVWTGPATPAGTCSISWSTRPNPDTTGSSDALLSEVVIYNHTAGSYVAIEQFTHAVSAASTSNTLTIGGVWNGSALLGAPAARPKAARISRSFHNHVEVAEDWVAARTASAGVLPASVEPIAPSAAGAKAEWAGQVNAGFVGATANALRGRMLSPLINEVYRNPRTITHELLPVQWYTSAPGSSAYRAWVTSLRWVLPATRYAVVRVRVTLTATSGTPSPVGVRCYSCNRPHQGLGAELGGEPKPALEYTYVQGKATASGWLNLGLIDLSVLEKVIPGWVGTSTMLLAIAYDPDGESTNEANTELKINAWQVRPALEIP